jgi:hypothetical protein
VIGDAICRCRVCFLVRLIGVAGEATLAANIDASGVCCCAVSSRQDGPHRTSEKCHHRKKSLSLDQLVSARKEYGRHGQTERLGGFEIDD